MDILQPKRVLLDVQFPTGTGLDLLRKFRATNSSVDVILITAAKEVDTLREALHCVFFDYTLKPLVFERLQEALHNFQQHLQKLQTMQKLAQRDVDKVLPRHQGAQLGSSPADTRLPKGIDSLTVDKIRVVFSQPHQPLCAEEAGETIGASRTTARRYLEYLVSTMNFLLKLAMEPLAARSDGTAYLYKSGSLSDELITTKNKHKKG